MRAKLGWKPGSPCRLTGGEPLTAHREDWRGRFHAGDGWAAYRGAAGENRLHAHTAMQLVLSTDAATLRGPDGVDLAGRALVARSGARHALAPTPDVLLVFLEPQSVAAKRISDALGPEPLAALPPALAALIDLDAPLPHCAAALVETPARPAAEDPRLSAALTFLARAEGARPVARAAADVGLSPARLRALSMVFPSCFVLPEFWRLKQFKLIIIPEPCRRLQYPSA